MHPFHHAAHVQLAWSSPLIHWYQPFNPCPLCVCQIAGISSRFVRHLLSLLLGSSELFATFSVPNRIFFCPSLSNGFSAENQSRLNHARLIDGSGLPYLGRYVDTVDEDGSDGQGYQQSLTDARLGKFSHVAIAYVNEFGETDADIRAAFDTLLALGVGIRIATYPNLNAAEPDGRFLVDVLLDVAQFESANVAKRVHEGLIRQGLSAN